MDPTGQDHSNTKPPRHERPETHRRTLPIRLWLAAPDWGFRMLGAGFFFGYLAYRLPPYLKNFWALGAYYSFKSGYRLQLPWTYVLVDVTFLLIGLAYIFRTRAKARADHAGEIIVALTGAFWPFLPFMAGAILKWSDPASAQAFDNYLWRRSLSLTQVLAYSGLMIVGNGLDVWGYGVLFRSLSIVPEARVLKVTGPYRLIRHPIYFGQMLAQAGVWLVYANFHAVLVLFWAVFVCFQLYRARLEEQVLERSFGNEYIALKRRTFWFTR